MNLQKSGKERRMKTTLCSSCVFGLIREVEFVDALFDIDTLDKWGKKKINKCLLGGDFYDYKSLIISCNRYKKAETKITYHDPDFDKFEASMDEAEDREKAKAAIDIENTSEE